MSSQVFKFKYPCECLIEQAYVREPKQAIKQLLDSEGKALEDTLTIRRFVRYQIGR